jgi:hypothetical protein
MSTLNQQFRINGVVDTNNNVFQNLEQFAMAAGAWVTYDANAGRWSVVINGPGNSVRSFTDDNIVGSIAINSTGITEFYNRVRVTYAREDLDDQIDFVEAATPSFQRLANEPDNTLEMTLDLVSDPVQALNIGARELKQSRVNNVITFTTDYTGIDLQAGDIIDITNSAVGYVNRLFRIVQMRESDSDTGEIQIEIVALEYDAAVYINDLIKLDRSVQNEIVTIGGIAQPAAPTVTRVERNSRPRLELSAVVPEGLVAGMEFWITQDGTNFYLQGTERPAQGGVYSTGATVSLDVTNISFGTIGVRVRAINSKTSSVFSATTTVTFEPVQVPDAIDPNTKIEDSLGGLATALGIIELLKGLDGLFSGDLANNEPAGNLFNSIEDLLLDDPEFTGNVGGFQQLSFSKHQAGNVVVVGNITPGSNAQGTISFPTIGDNVIVDSGNSAVAYLNNAVQGFVTGTDGNTVAGSFDNNIVLIPQVTSNVAADTSLFSIGVPGTANTAPQLALVPFVSSETNIFLWHEFITAGGGPWTPDPLVVTSDTGIIPAAGPIIIRVNFRFFGVLDPDELFKDAATEFYLDDTLANFSQIIHAFYPGVIDINLSFVVEDAEPNQEFYFVHTVGSEAATNVEITVDAYQLRGTIDPEQFQFTYGP